MSKIIKPNEPEMINVRMSPEMAKFLASILGEYAIRIPNPPEEFLKEKTEEELAQIMKYHEERKKFAGDVSRSFFTNSHIDKNEQT